MILVLMTTILTILKLLNVTPLAELSWWWVAGLFAVTLLWFEYIERLIGWDKKNNTDPLESIRQARIKKYFKNRK